MNAEPAQFGALAARYNLDVRPETIPELLERFSLRMPEPAAA
jgi:hypothetical protein